MSDMRSSAMPPLGRGFAGRRQGVPLSGEVVIKAGNLLPNETLPRVLKPATEGVDLNSWAAGRRDELEKQLLEFGGILFRGFEIDGISKFQEFVASLSDDLLDYVNRSTPRSAVSGKIYSSTEYPAEQTIPMHNEMSYTRSWPRKIWFYSVQVAEAGGETPIVDSRKVFRDISEKVREKFIEKGVMYVRNYGAGIDLSWQDVFQTEDRAEVEAFCRQSGIEFEWRGANELTTRQVCQATAKHPVTGEDLWFNQAHLFHVSSLDPALREFLLEELGEDGLSRNSYYGDHSRIEDEALEEIREAYRANLVVFPWQKDDLLMLDNMLIAHGRRPFEGQRKVVVGMADAWSDEKQVGSN